MTIEIIVTYTRAKLLDVPEELAVRDRDGDPSDEFKAWVADQADCHMGDEPLIWAGSQAYDTASNELLYDVG